MGRSRWDPTIRVRLLDQMTFIVVGEVLGMDGFRVDVTGG